MKKLKYFLLDFKNAFISDINEIKKEYPIYELWEKSNKINDKFKVINERTEENMKRYLYSNYYDN